MRPIRRPEHPRGRRRGAPFVLSVAAAGMLAAVISVPTAAQAASAGPIKGAGSGRCIDVPGANAADGTQVALWDCNGGANQSFTLTSSGELQVLGKCLDAYGASRAEGTKVVLWACNGGANQQWTTSNGSLRGVDSGLCIDATGQGTANSTLLVLWGCNSQSNQSWQLSSGGTTTPPTTGTGSTSPSTGGSGDRGLHVEGKNLVDGNGQKVVYRGIEHILRWGDYAGSGTLGDVPWEGGSNDAGGSQLPEIAKTGANSVRVFGGTPQELDGVLHKAIIEQHMWASVGRQDWTNATVIATLKKYSKYVTLHIGGEVSDPNENNWRTKVIGEITQARALGYTSPIEIYSNGYGQTLATILHQGDAVFNADPLKDIVFGFQLYSELAKDVNGALNQAAAFDHPIIVGTCYFGSGITSGYGNTPTTYRQVWDGTGSRNLNSVVWAWHGDGEGDDMSVAGYANNLTSIGKYIVNDSPYSIKKMSVKSSYLLNAKVS